MDSLEAVISHSHVSNFISRLVSLPLSTAILVEMDETDVGIVIVSISRLVSLPLSTAILVEMDETDVGIVLVSISRLVSLPLSTAILVEMDETCWYSPSFH